MGNNLYKLMRQKDLNYRQLEEITGIPKSTLCGMALGKPVDRPRGEVIARALDATLADVFPDTARQAIREAVLWYVDGKTADQLPIVIDPGKYIPDLINQCEGRARR